jgi:PAS domain S-box-containing protein
MEAERQALVRDLRERVKELRALQAAANLLRQDDLETAEVLMRIATLLPAAMLHADVAAAAIAFGAEERSTAGFRPTPWMMEAGFATSDGIMGRLRIVYLQARPREKEGPFLAEERALIDAVAEMLRTYFERRRAAVAVQHSQRMSRLAGRLASVGAWAINLPGRELEWSVEMHEIMEVPVGEPPTLEEALNAYPPESRSRVAAVVDACITNGTAFDIEEQIDTAKGRRLWIRAIGEVVRDATGRIVRLQGAFQDITNRKAEETARQALADRLTAMLESLSDGFFTLDRNWRFSYVNREAERVLQRSRDELLGRDMWSEFPEIRGGIFEEKYTQARRDKVPATFEAFYPPLNAWFEVRAFPTGANLAVYFRDITATRQATQALQLSQARFQEMAENIGDVFFNYDAVNRRLLYANGAYEQIWRRPLTELKDNPESYLDTVVPEDRAAAQQAFARQLAGEETSVEFRIRRPDGEQRWINEHAVPICNAQGKVERVVGTMRDITEQKLAAEKTREGEERFRLLARSTKDAIWDWNLLTGDFWWSEGFESLFGYQRNEIEPTVDSWSNRVHPEDREAVVAEVDRALEAGDAQWSGEYRFLHKDGRSIYVLDRGFIIRDATGKAVRMIGGMTDLTERKAAEEATRRTNEVLEGIVAALQEITTARLELQGVMELMAARAQTLTGGTGAIIEMLEGDDMVYRAAAGSAAAHAGLRLPRHGSLAGLAVQEGRSLICDEAETDARVDREVCRRMGVRSLVVAPLRDGRDIIGVLKVLSDRPRAFGPRDLNNLQILVESLGTVIQRQRAAATLQESEAQYRLLFASNPHPMWVFEQKTLRFLAVNRAAVKHYGYSEAEFLAMTVLEIRAADDVTTFADAVARMPAAGHDVGLRRHRRKDGTIIDVEASSDSHVWNGRPARLVLAHDVTARLQAERELVNTNRALRMLSRGNEALIRADSEPKLLQAICEIAVELGGYRMAWVGYAGKGPDKPIEPQVVAGVDEGYFQEIGQLTWAEDQPGGQGPAGRTIRNGVAIVISDFGEDYSFQRWLKPAQARGYCGVVCLPLQEAGRTFGLLGLYLREVRAVPADELRLLQELANDMAFGIIALRVRAERRQAQQEIAQQAALLDQAQDAIFVQDLEHRITYWNKSAERLYGWTMAEALGRPLDQLLQPDPGKFADAVRQVRDKGEWSGEIQKHAKTQVPLTVSGRWTLLRDEAGQPKAILSIDTDVTERKKLEAQFLRAQRMESIGTLAGGIAHDLNNLLAPIVMGVGLLQQYQPNDKAQQVIRNIERSAKRGTDLVKQVLSFARGVEGSRVAVHLKHVIREIVGMTESTFPKNITVDTNTPNDLWLVTGDPTQLNQVLLNLCVNARDAMPNGGRLVITAANTVIDEQYAVMNRGVVSGRYVRLEVTDNGSGMPQEVVDRIFEPFFTTKELGKGTGLGLSTVLGIVRSHGGFVNVYSEPGKGSTFKVYLPAQELDQAGAAPAADRPETATRGHGELILVVDDEASILSVTQQTLEAFGYRVITAEDGAQAIGLYAMHREEVAVVLTDMMMPVMDGPALIAALRRINPGVRVIAASGLNANGNVARATLAGVKHFLAKPYTAEALLGMLKKILTDASSRPPFAP